MAFNLGTFGSTNNTQQQPAFNWPNLNRTPTTVQNTNMLSGFGTSPVVNNASQQPVGFGTVNNQQQQQTGILAQPQQHQPFIFPQPQQQAFQFNNQNQTTPTQPLNAFGQPLAQQQIVQQRQPTWEEAIQYIRQLETEIQRQRCQSLAPAPAQLPVQNNPLAFPCNVNSNAVSIPAFLENGSPIIMQIPMGRASSFALMHGYRPMSTPQGIQFYSPENYCRYPDNSSYWLGYERGNQRLGRSPSFHSLNSSRSRHYLPPSRQQGSTCIADPYLNPVDRPYFQRPYTSPILSSPSSTSILFDNRRNPDLKMRTLPWRKGYGTHYPYGGLSQDDIIRRNYEAIVNDDLFGRRKKEKYNPTPQSWRDWKWKTLDEDVVTRRMRQDVFENSHHLSRPKRGVSFFDERDHNYFRTPERRQGPPIRSHLDDYDQRIYPDLWFSNNKKTPEVVGNLPVKFHQAQQKGILKNVGRAQEERTSPVFFSSFKYSDASRNQNSSSSTQTPCLSCNNHHTFIPPLIRQNSAEVFEVYRAPTKPRVPTLSGSEKKANERLITLFGRTC